MKGVNKVILVGTTGQDPDIRYTASGSCIANLSLATSVKYKDKRTGDVQEKTTWHQCVGFGKTAELIGQYVRKGSKLYIEGSNDNQTYEKDGIKRYVTKVAIKDFVLLNSIEGHQANTNNQNAKQNQTYNQQGSNPSDFPDDDLDQIPF